MTPAGELFSRTAQNEGRHVLTLRCLESDDEFVVECAAGADRDRTLGPYVALEFLDCQLG